MPKLPVLSAKDAIKVLREFGFQVYRQTGSHIHLWNEERKLLVTGWVWNKGGTLSQTLLILDYV